MEGTMPMNYNLMPSSLKHRALLKLGTNLWIQSDIWTSTDQSYALPILDEQVSRNTVWLSIEEKVIKKVLKLSLPGSLNKELINVIIPIGHEILRWTFHLYRFCDFFRHLPYDNSRLDEIMYYIRWTSYGMIDQKRTAEELIKRDNIDITMRFKLACDCCLENDIKALWNEMPQNLKRNFYNEEDPYSVEQTDLVTYWTYFVNEVSGTCSISYLCKRVAFRGNKVATEYFLQKLTPMQKADNLGRIGKGIINSYPYGNRFNSDVVCCLLSHMNESQQKEVFINCPYEVLLIFLDLPCQSFFLETVKLLWDFLSKSEYKDLLEDIVDKVINGHKDSCNYQFLFLVFWQQNSLNKKFDIEWWTITVLLPKLFEAEFEESIRLILNNSTLVKKDEFIFSSSGKTICEDIMTKEKWYLFSVFVGKCISSKELIVKFRNECDTWSLSKPEYKRKLFQTLDDLIKSCDKNV